MLCVLDGRPHTGHWVLFGVPVICECVSVVGSASACLWREVCVGWSWFLFLEGIHVSCMEWSVLWLGACGVVGCRGCGVLMCFWCWEGDVWPEKCVWLCCVSVRVWCE